MNQLITRLRESLQRHRNAAKFDAAGLLDGLSGDARTARLNVLERLHADGASVADLVHSTREGRLGHALFETALSPRRTTYTLSDISHLSDIPLDDVERWFRATGRGVSGITDKDYHEDDLRLALLLTEYRELGLDEDALFATIRILGRNIWAAADAAEIASPGAVGRGEPRSPRRRAPVCHEVRRFSGFQTDIIASVLTANVRGLLNSEDDSQVGSGRQIAVCFAELVGFTRLGRELTPEELGRVAQQLDTVTTDVVEPSTRFVKMVGDAVMLISPDPDALCTSLLRLMEAADSAGLPPLHAGIAWGTAVPIAGDWVGQPINLASRIAALATPGQVLVDEDMITRLSDSVVRRSAGTFSLKGFERRRELFQIGAAEV